MKQTPMLTWTVLLIGKPDRNLGKVKESKMDNLNTSTQGVLCECDRLLILVFIYLFKIITAIVEAVFGLDPYCVCSLFLYLRCGKVEDGLCNYERYKF